MPKGWTPPKAEGVMCMGHVPVPPTVHEGMEARGAGIRAFGAAPRHAGMTVW